MQERSIRGGAPSMFATLQCSPSMPTTTDGALHEYVAVEMSVPMSGIGRRMF